MPEGALHDMIAAHAAGKSGLWDPDYTHQLVGMFERFPHLYADNSALCTLNRSHTIARILHEPAMDRLLHGSDFPVPVTGLGPFRHGHIDRHAWQASRRESHPLQRDVRLKRAIGFSEETFTRLDTLLA